MTCQNFQSHNNFPLNIIHWLHDVNWELLPNIAFSFFSLVSKIKNNKLRLEENFEKSQNFYCTNRKRIVNIKNVLFLVNIKNLLRICKFIVFVLCLFNEITFLHPSWNCRLGAGFFFRNRNFSVENFFIKDNTFNNTILQKKFHKG